MVENRLPTFREAWADIMELLHYHYRTIDVPVERIERGEIGKAGGMELPNVLVHLVPINASVVAGGNPFVNYARVVLICGAVADNQPAAIVEAVELAARVLSVLKIRWLTMEPRSIQIFKADGTTAKVEIQGTVTFALRIEDTTL